MAKLIIRGGSPGLIRVELEGGEGVDVSSALSIYQGLHELQPFLQALADSVPSKPSMPPPAEVVDLDMGARKGKTLPPTKGAA